MVLDGRDGFHRHADLVMAARANKPQARARLYAEFRTTVHGLALARVPHFAVDDIVQATFVKVFEKLGDLREPARFAGWLRQIAVHECHDYHRNRARDSAVAQDPQEAHSPQMSEALALLEALKLLPEHYCEVLVLRYVEGLSGPEIASQTGMTEKSVRVKLVRGKKMLREQYESASAG